MLMKSPSNFFKYTRFFSHSIQATCTSSAAHFTELFKRANLEPTRKFLYPQTESQEYGWISKPIVRSISWSAHITFPFTTIVDYSEPVVYAVTVLCAHAARSGQERPAPQSPARHHGRHSVHARLLADEGAEREHGPRGQVRRQRGRWTSQVLTLNRLIITHLFLTKACVLEHFWVSRPIIFIIMGMA